MNIHKILCWIAIISTAAFFGLGGAYLYAKYDARNNSTPIEVREDTWR